MRTRMLTIFALTIASLATFGCPPAGPNPSDAPDVALGTWLFHFTGATGFTNQILAVGILAAGQGDTGVATPPTADGNFGGTVTWSQAGATFSMSQSYDGDTYEYTGTVLSNSVMQGTVQQTSGSLNPSTTLVAFLFTD